MYFLFAEMAYKFAVVHGCESILIPGKFIDKECPEELGEYMTKYHQWIGDLEESSLQGSRFL